MSSSFEDDSLSAKEDVIMKQENSETSGTGHSKCNACLRYPEEGACPPDCDFHDLSDIFMNRLSQLVGEPPDVSLQDLRERFANDPEFCEEFIEIIAKSLENPPFITADGRKAVCYNELLFNK